MLARPGKIAMSLPNGRVLIALVAVFAVLITFQPNALATGGNARPPKLPKSSIVVSDKFSGHAGPLAEHLPKIDLLGGGWQPVVGDWQVRKGAASNSLGYSEPYFTAINPSISNYSVSIDVTWFGASEAGMVFRYEDAENYYSVVFTGKNLELRKTIDGVTQRLKKKKLKWKRYDTKTIEITVDGRAIEVKVGKAKIKVKDKDLELSRSVGAIVQRTDNDSFADIEVRAIGPQVSPEPIEIPLIGDAVLFDSFDDTTDPIDLRIHKPDYPTSGVAWSSELTRPNWIVSGGVMTANTGGRTDSLRVTIDAGIANPDIYTQLTWRNGLTGIVYRYINRDNWWMTWVDGNNLVTASFENRGFKIQDVTPFVWGSNATRSLRIRINEHAVRIYVDHGELVTTLILSDILQGATRVGIFNRHGNTNVFSEFVVAESPNLPYPDPPVGIPPIPPVPAVPPPLPSELVLYDSFSDISGMWNGAHDPDQFPDFRTWEVDSGGWFADFEQLTELTGAQSDQRAVIDTGVEDSVIKVKIDWEAGRTGVAFRYRDEGNWAMVWYDGLGDVVFGKVVAGRFTEVDRMPLKLKKNGKLEFTIWVENDTTNVFAGKKLLGSFDVSELPTATYVGLFHRNIDAARFDNLAVTALAEQPEPVELDFTQVVFDSFSQPEPEPEQVLEPVRLDSNDHIIDLAPTGAKWQDYSNGWHIFDGTAYFERSVAPGAKAAIRSVSGDQRVSVDVLYKGGIVGLLFRHDSEQFWYGFWFDGNDLVLAKRIFNTFTEIKRYRVVWGSFDEVRTLSVISSSDDITGFINGVDVIKVHGDNDLLGNNGAALHAREAPQTTRFDNFSVEVLTE